MIIPIINRADDIGTENHRLAMQSIDQRTDQWTKHDARKHGNQRTRGERGGRPICFGDSPDECKSRECAADTGNGLAHPKNPKGGDQRSYCVVKTFLNSPSQNTPYRTTATHLYKALMCRNLERILISQGLSTALLCYTTC